jgi:hypothetical protein
MLLVTHILKQDLQSASDKSLVRRVTMPTVSGVRSLIPQNVLKDLSASHLLSEAVATAKVG